VGGFSLLSTNAALGFGWKRWFDSRRDFLAIGDERDNTY
jgi:hypothetical protein